MIWFNNNSEKLEKELKASQQNFRFDQENLKARILQSIATQPQKSSQFSFAWHIPKFALSLAVIVLLVSGTFAFASNSQPGDKLFPVTKLSEQVILSLPLPEDQLAKIETKIVTRRLKALEEVPTIERAKETNESLNHAVEKIIDNKNRLKIKGDQKRIEKLDKELDKLEILATENQKNIENLEKTLSEPHEKEQVRKHLKEFKHAKEKVQDEIKNRRLHGD